MKIVVPYPSYWPYVRRGVERMIHDLSGFLSRRGHEVHLITSTPGKARVAYDGEVKVTYLRQLSHPLMFRYAAWLRPVDFGIQASRLLAREQADVAHLWSYSGIMWAPLLRRAFKLPYLFHLMMRDHVWPDRFSRSLFAELMRGADRVVSLTQGGADEVQAQFNIACGVLPPPVDLDTFRPCAPRDPARPIVLFPGDLADPRKGGTLMLRAWTRVRQREPHAILALAGPFGLAGWFPYQLGNTMLAKFDLVSDPAARAAIDLRGPGRVDDLPAWYSSAAVTVLPSFDEAFGMVLTESLACGTPVVASSHAGPSEIVGSPDIGTTISLREYADVMSAKRANELADAVLHGIEISRRPQTRNKCREWASQWSLDQIGPRAEVVLGEVAAVRQTMSRQRPVSPAVA
jgi:glycosyltransferase involved in cell wall biosynthesis